MRRRRSGCVTFASRWTVATAYPPGSAPSVSRISERSRASGAKRRVASAITSPTTARRPATPSLASCSAERSSGQSSSAEMRSTAIRFRSSGIVEVEAPQPGLDVRDRDLAGGLGAGQRRVRVAVDEHPVRPLGLDRGADAGLHRARRRRSAGRAGSAARRGRARRRRPPRATASQCCPVWSTTSSIPASRSASESGADLMNWGRFPTTERTRIRRYDTRRSRAVSSVGRAGDS